MNADSPPATGSGATSSSANQSTPNSSMWSLPTPKEKTMSSVWASFRSGTPGSAGPQRPDNSDHTRSSSYQTSNGSYFDSQPGSSVNLTTSSLAVEATAQSLAINAPRDPATNIIPPPPVETVEEHDEDGSDGGNETSSSHDNSSMTHASPQAVSPTALPDTTTPNRPENTTRPSMYHQLSQSMVNFGSSDEGPATAGLGADRASTRPQLETIRSREGAPTKIEIPKPAQMTNTPLFSPGAEWAKPPPTPAAGFAGVFWNRKDGDKPALKRRRSAGDTEGAPPGYEPPHPGVVIPRPRDEEGREKLPEYWCAVSGICLDVTIGGRIVTDTFRYISREPFLERWNSRHRVFNPAIEVGRNITISSEEPHCLCTNSIHIDSHSRPTTRSYPPRTSTSGNQTCTSTCQGRGVSRTRTL